jgi:flagellar hook-associated protein 2
VDTPAIFSAILGKFEQRQQNRRAEARAMTISSTTGLVSGIDYQSIIDKMTSLNERPITILENKQSDLQSVSDALGTVSSVLTTLYDQVESMLTEDDLNSTSASSSDEDYLTVEADSTASLGSYSIEVTQLAKASRATASGLAEKTSTVASSSGNFAITVADTTSTYEVTATTTLQDLADAINSDDDSLVKATIVDTGDDTTPYTLVLTSKTTGTDNDITVSDNDTDLTFTTTAGQNAKISIDDLTITRSTNTFDDVVDGLTFTAVAVTDDDSPVTVSVSRDSSTLEESINSFVDDYNAVMTQIESLTAYDSSTETSGVLGSVSAIRSLKSALAKMISTQVSNTESDYTSLASIGLTLDEDGVLSFDSSSFEDALDDDAAGVEAVFGRMGNSLSSEVTFVSSTTSTASGSYALNVTTAAERATITATQTLTTDGLTSAENLTFTIGDTTDDTSDTTFTVGLDAGDTLDQIIVKLNAAFAAQDVDYTATSDDGVLILQSDEYGDEQTFSVTSDQDSSTSGQLGIGTTTITDTGVDVEATLGGVSLKGDGQTLTGLSDSKFEGLELTVTSEEAMTTTVNLTNGIANQMMNYLDTYLDSSTGIITVKQDSLADSISSINDTIDSIQTRVDAEAARMKKQFTALETTLANYSTIASYITAISSSTSSSDS